MNLLQLHKFLTLVISMVWLTYTLPAHAAKPPTPFTASYKVEKYKNIVAIMQLSLQLKDDRYIYTSETNPKGLLDLFSNDKVFEQSILQWDAEHQQLYLLEYQFKRAEKPKDNQQFTMTWNAADSASCAGIYRKQPFTLTLESPAWDRLSVQLALMADLKDTNQTKDYRYNIIDGAKLSDYQFLLEAEQTIKIDQREYRTLKLKRSHESGKRTTFLWLAPELGYIPVRVEQHKKGELNFSMELAAPPKVTP